MPVRKGGDHEHLPVTFSIDSQLPQGPAKPEAVRAEAC